MTYEKSTSKGQVFLTFWNNETEKGEKYISYTLEKRYKDKEGNWKSTSSFSETDLQNALVVINKALAEKVVERVGKTE